MRAKYLLLVVITFLVSVMTIEKCCADDVFKLKQKIGTKGVEIFWFHATGWLFTEIISYAEKDQLYFGAGPIVKMRNFKNYIIPTVEINTNSPHLPIKSLVLDIIMENKKIKNFQIMSRQFLQWSKKLDSFEWKGKDYIQYKITNQINLGLQDERIYQGKSVPNKSKWTVWLGPVVEYELKNKMVLNGFVGIKTGHPFDKMVWWEIKYKI